MPLVTTKEMFQKAYHGGYAIGAVTVAVVLIRRRMEEGGKRSRYHRGR